MEPEGSLPHTQEPATCSYPEPQQLNRCPHPTTLRSILILSYHLHLDIPNHLLPSGFRTKTVYVPFLSLIRATCPAQLTLLDLITRRIFSEEQLCVFFYSPVTSSLLGPNSIFSTLFSKTLNLHSSLNARDQVSQLLYIIT
jgi:hypothetical protein